MLGDWKSKFIPGQKKTFYERIDTLHATGQDASRFQKNKVGKINSICDKLKTYFVMKENPLHPVQVV